MKAGLLILLCMLLPFGRAMAMADSVQYQRYDINSGLPSNNVYCCVEDRLGYMWLATDGGIVRYNGISFKVFNTYTGLPSNDYYGLQEDGAGRMWIFGLTTHFGYIRSDRYHEVMPEQLKSSRIGNHESFEVNGKRIALTEDSRPRLILFDTADALQYDLSAGCRYYISNTGQVYIYRTAAHTLEVRDINHLLVVKNWLNSKAYEAFREKFPPSQSDFCYGTFLYAVSNNQVGCINLTTGKIVIKDITEYGAAPNDNIYTYHIYDYFYTYMLPGQKSLHLIAGNIIYNLDDQLNLVQKMSLPANIIGSAQPAFWKKDRMGNEWFATNNAGMICRLAARNYIEYVPAGDSLLSSRFCGSYDGHSWWWHTRGHTFFMADTAAHTRSWEMGEQRRLESVVHLSDSILFLSFSRGGKLLNQHTGNFMPISAADFLRDSMVVDESREGIHSVDKGWENQKAMSFYRNRKLLMLGGDSRLSVFYRKHDRLYLKRLNKNYCSQMTYDAYSNKYILYGIDEVFVYDPETDYLAKLSSVQDILPAAGLITTIRTDSFSNIYMLCAHELFVFNRNTIRLQKINTGFNLTNAMLETVGNKLVLMGNFGVAVARVSAQGITGPFHVSCNVRNHYYKRISNVWVTGNDVITAQTDRSWIRVNLSMLLQDTSLVHRPESGNFSLVLTDPEMKRLHQEDTLQVLPGTKKIMLDAINFNGNGVLHYYYRTGDGEWQQSASGEILVDNITPEANTPLQVQVSDDSWQSGLITIVLYKVPYWWQTGKCKILLWVLAGIVLLLLVLLTVYITSMVVRRSNEKRRMLTDLELRAIHAQINPHFIFNTLSTALYFISRKEYENAYGHVNKFSHLLRSYLKSSHDRYVLLSEEIDMLKRYVDLQQTRFEEKFDFELAVDNKVPVNNIQIPSLLLQPLVENAINHGLFHRKEKGLLKIGFEQGDTSDQLIVTIEDNGIGRAAAIRMKQESVADKESYGNQLTQKLMDIFRRYEAMDIEIQYIDKELPETGTIVKLIIANMRYIV